MSSNENVHILLVEDEKTLSDVIALNLRMEDYHVQIANDGNEALQAIRNQIFDLILLDIMLPHVNGFDILKEVRATNQVTSVLIISAKDATTDRIQGLKLGADDYLTKPFDLEELMLRVKALLRRGSTSSISDVYEFGSNSINFKTFEARNQHDTIQLTKREADLLKLLVDKEGEVVSRQEILKKVWGYDVLPNTRTIDNFILAFRKYFEKDPKQPEYFHSVWGVGYRFTA
ncbi:MAG: response regulator transcription factor [Saprospiraceae bacterium]|nr:response regulator transcription factor [Saprospiraceae bacterium]